MALHLASAAVLLGLFACGALIGDDRRSAKDLLVIGTICAAVAIVIALAAPEARPA